MSTSSADQTTDTAAGLHASRVPPGMLRLVHLKEPGKLQYGDLLETQRHGTCSVVAIHSTDTIDIKDAKGTTFRLSGLGLKATMVRSEPTAALSPH